MSKCKPSIPSEIDRLYSAVADYVKANGGAVVVIGGIQIEQSLGDLAMNFHVTVRCTGRLPKFAGPSVSAKVKREAARERDARIAELEKDLAQSRVQETRNYLASPAMETFAELKHSQAGTVLAMLGDGAISRGKCCEALAQLAHGVPFDEIPLPQENGRQFTLDEIPAEVVAKLESEVEALRKDAFTVLHLRGVLEKVRLRGGLGSDKSDSQVAGAIRMMTREDVDHEMVCVMARDRIIALSDAVETLRKERDAAIAAMEDATRQNAIQVDRLVAEARELREKLETLRQVPIQTAEHCAEWVVDHYRIGIAYEIGGNNLRVAYGVAKQKFSAIIRAAMSAADQEQG